MTLLPPVSETGRCLVTGASSASANKIAREFAAAAYPVVLVARVRQQDRAGRSPHDSRAYVLPVDQG